MDTYLLLGFIGLGVIAAALIFGDLIGGHLEALSGDWFSVEAIGAFLAAFGFCAAIAAGAGAPSPVSAAIGVGSGVVFAGGAAALSRLVRGGGTDHTPQADDVIGYEGVVVSAIPTTGLGNVKIFLGGHTLRFNAGADVEIEPGTRVHVTGVLSPTAITVAPVWHELPTGHH